MDESALQSVLPDSQDTSDLERNETRSTQAWVTSKVIPLLAGTFGPMASSFNICASVDNWRVVVEPISVESEGVPIDNARWLVALHGLSLAIAILANTVLLVHM